MITSVNAVSPPTPVSGAAPAADAATQAPQANAANPAPALEAPPAAQVNADPLELSVERGQDGIYVYSLKDPSTGRLVAVIPREHAQGTSKGSDYQAGGYVQLKA